MRYPDYMPRKDWDFLQWVVVLLNSLGESLERFNFPVAEFNRLTALKDDFEVKLHASWDVSTRTSVMIHAKTTARRLLEAEARQSVKEFLAHNRAVSNPDRVMLGIPIYKTTRVPSAVAVEAPLARVDTSMLGHVNIFFRGSEGKHRRAKPPGQHCVEAGWVIADAPPASWEELLHSAVTTRSPLTLSFEYHERGKTVYFALRWENTRGEKGPWSEIRGAIIP
jgi:hypothetical protein